MRDWLHGAFVSTLTSALYFAQQSMDAGHLSFDWKGMGMAAIGGLVAYLIKKLITPAQEIKKIED